MKGWIKVHRNILRKSWFKNTKIVNFWLYCQLKATHKSFRAIIGYQPVLLRPGQFIFGRKKAAEETGLSEREIRTCRDFLEKEGALTIKPTKKFSIITIVNWAKYQGAPPGKDHKEDQEATKKRPHTRSMKKEEENHLGSAPGAQFGKFISFWREAYRKKFGIPYRGPGKDKVLVKKLMKKFPPEKLQELGRSFFQSPDPFIQKSDYSIGSFYSQITKTGKEKRRPIET